uniref:Uncharacterized protein n=1 Tax=Catharus ustulatus TaxID=91951 RepID=A0A8C3UQU5_CATUS
MAVAGSGWSLARLAEALGSSEQALRLILSILMGKKPKPEKADSSLRGWSPRSTKGPVQQVLMQKRS